MRKSRDAACNQRTEPQPAGQRDPDIYGTMTLTAIEEKIQERAKELGTEVAFFQSNSEGALIDHIQQKAPGSQASSSIRAPTPTTA